jgi:hypothetical protein
MMQKQFASSIKYWLAGVIAITALFAFSTEVIAKGKVLESKVFINDDNGKKVCLRIIPKKGKGCYQAVKCRGFNSFKPEKATPRRDGESLKEFLKIKDAEPLIQAQGNACQTVIIDNGYPNTFSVCIYIKGLGTQCFTFK